MTNAYDHAYQFLKIETPRGLIKGESRDARHVNEIDVYGFLWGMTPTMIKELRIIKGVDSASTPFAWLLHNQALINKGVLSLCKAGEHLPAFLRLVFEQARVTSMSMRVNDGPGPMLLEEVTISFKIFRAEYIRPREEAMSKVFLDTPKPVMVAGIGSGLLKGLFKGEAKADRVDKTPDASGAAETKQRGFVGKLRGNTIQLSKVELKKINYVKRDRVEYAQLAREFDTKVRKDYLKSLASDSAKIPVLQKAGLNEID